MLGVIKIFLSTSGRTKWTVLVSLLIAGIVEGVGLAALMPLLSLVLGGGQIDDSRLTQIVTQSLEYLGLSPNLEVLPDRCMYPKTLCNPSNPSRHP